MPDERVTAKTREGYDLPVIDVTNPRFAVPDDPDAARALHDAFVASERRRRFIPPFIMRMMLRSAARRSRLIRALFNTDAGFLDGLSTYVMKLGADNLVPPYDGPVDRRLGASPHVGLLRLRMQQTARLLADGLVAELERAGGALNLINIGGGPSLDSINALILLNRARPDLLRRPIGIHVLDSAEDGPFFGANARAALKQEGRPLHGLDIAWARHGYDWNEPAPLGAACSRADVGGRADRRLVGGRAVRVWQRCGHRRQPESAARKRSRRRAGGRLGDPGRRRQATDDRRDRIQAGAARCRRLCAARGACGISYRQGRARAG